ncbi:anti-sigma factor [Crocosphaera sp. UHCC 0190]|uniref:anti-sigma factor family protein n=1 Tax=Crocosphaera sp. UHCC 0190 TaxID=3110246 RepID=UPI002B1F598E|nr:anti-sigma factor [Crocosphaera sp. UHCC 0190]MEA5509969.1 anti-sigma factor [Crocosphaera sp. UHCC 0190]
MMSDFQQEKGPEAIDSRDMDNQFERFELLSAYLDGEVTATERKQVQQWLDTDPQFHHLYKQLLRLQREIPTAPVPHSPVTAEQLSERVFDAVDDQQRSRRGVLVGGLAIAAIVVGAVSHLGLRDGFLSPRYAENLTNPQGEGEALTIALNRPVVDIPPTVP